MTSQTTILTLTDDEAVCIRAALQALESSARAGGNDWAAKTAQALRHRVIEAQDAAFKSVE